MERGGSQQREPAAWGKLIIKTLHYSNAKKGAWWDRAQANNRIVHSRPLCDVALHRCLVQRAHAVAHRGAGCALLRGWTGERACEGLRQREQGGERVGGGRASAAWSQRALSSPNAAEAQAAVGAGAAAPAARGPRARPASSTGPVTMKGCSAPSTRAPPASSARGNSTNEIKTLPATVWRRSGRCQQAWVKASTNARALQSGQAASGGRRGATARARVPTQRRSAAEPPPCCCRRGGGC